MISKFTLSTLLMMITGITFSQIWVSDNAVWHYKYHGTIGYGFIKIVHVGDSVIMNKQTKVFKTTAYQFGNNQFGETVFFGTEVRDTNYTYTSADTVYFLRNGAFEVLYDFSASVGDTWDRGESAPDQFFCSIHSLSVVSNTGTETILGNPYRTVDITSPDSSSYKHQGKANERFGMFSENSQRYSLVFPIKAMCEPMIDETAYYNFLCFQDDDMVYNPGSQNCEPYSGLTEAELSSLSVFPNPFTDVINIVSENPIAEINMINSFGQKVAEWKLNEGKLNFELSVSEIPNSAYIIEVITSENVFYRTVVK